MPPSGTVQLSFMSLIKRLTKTNSNPTSNEPSHISKLPLELLALIFEIDIDPDLERLDRTPEYPLIISSVCRTWRHVALNISHLIWSTISIHPNRTLELPLLYLSRSGDTLLNICIGAYLEQEQSEKKSAGLRLCFHLILPYSHRWQNLKIYNHRNCLPDNLDTLPRVCAPNLTNFHLFVDNYDGLFPFFFDDGHKVPKLVHLRMDGIFRFSSQLTPFLSVQTLHLSCCGTELLSSEFRPFFKLFPSLRQLRLRECGPITVTSSRDQTAAILPNLVELEFVQNYRESLRSLILNVQMPLLRVVTLPIEEEPTWSYSWSPFTSLQMILPSVEILSVSGKLNRVSLIPQVFPNVRDFVLYETSSDWLPRGVMNDLGLAHHHARYWPLLERLTIRRWSKKSDAEYLISFIKGLLEWHGRTIQKVELVIPVLYNYYPSQILGLEESFKKMEVQLEIRF